MNRLEHLAYIIVSTEYSTEAHGNNGVALHHGFDHMLMGERIFTSRIEDKYRCFADHSSNVTVMDRIYGFTHATNADFAKVDGFSGFDNTIDIAAFLLHLTWNVTASGGPAGCVHQGQRRAFLAPLFLFDRAFRRPCLFLGRCCFLCLWHIFSLIMYLLFLHIPEY